MFKFPRPLVLVLVPALLAAAPAGAATVDDVDLFGEALVPQAAPPLVRALQAVREGRLDEALGLATAERQRAAAAGRSQGPALEVSAIVLARQGKIDESLATFGAALEAGPPAASTHTNRGIVLAAAGRAAEAEADFRAALAIDPSDRRAHQRLGLIHAARGERETAIGHLEAGTRVLPADYLGVRADLGQLYLETGRPADAVALLDRWREDPEAPDPVLETLGGAEAALGHGEAAKAINARLAERGTSLTGLVRHARDLLAAGDAAAAEARLAKAATAFPRAIQPRFELGNLKGATGRYEEALADYRAGLAIDPADPGLMKGASIAEYRLGHLPEALDLARTLAGREGAQPSDRLWLAALHEATGDIPTAIALYRDLAAADPGDWLSRNNLAALLTRTDPAEAVTLATEAARLAPKVAAVQDTLGWAQYKAGNLDEADRIFAALHAAAPERALPAYRLGLVRIAKGDAAGGRALLETALKAEPGFSHAAEAQALLGTN